MTTENRFNLIDEPWIPVVDAGRVSLKQLFSHDGISRVGRQPCAENRLDQAFIGHCPGCLHARR